MPGRALKLGNSLSAMFSLTVQPVCGTASTRARQTASAASPSSESVVRGSALETTQRADDALAAGELDACTGNDAGDRNAGQHGRSRSRAMSQRMNETMPIPPST